MGLLEQKGKVYLHRSKGCGRCGETGYRGRVALYEVMPIAGEIRRLIGASTDEIFDAAVSERHDHASPGRAPPLPRRRLLARGDPPRHRRQAGLSRGRLSPDS